MTKQNGHDFQVVDDKYRGLPKKSTLRSPVSTALVNGQTVFVPGGIQTRLASLAYHYGKRPHTRATEIDGVKGVVVWWTDR